MTALTQYDRLECPGLWRAGAESQRREVLVSFGDASLVIADQNEVALTHWSLPAVRRVNTGEQPAIYAPSPDDDETLEIDDPTMIEAIEKVLAAISRGRPRPGRLRLVIVSALVAALVALAVFWLPGALVRHTAGVVPPAKRLEIGRAILGNLTPVTGRRCETPLGRRALARLAARLDPGGRALHVYPDGVPGSAHLPGGITLLSAALMEDHEDPAVVAAHVLLEDLRAEAEDPLARLLDHAGLVATFRLLTTGTLRPDVLANYSETVLTAPPVEIGTARILDRFEAAGVPTTPYAYALDATGETTLELIEADPMRGKPAPAILSDGQWISLQGICGE